MSDNERPPIIDSVPGFNEQPIAETPDAQQIQPVQLEAFQGDPRRVIGHPSNPTNKAANAYAAQLAGKEDPKKWEGVPVTQYQGTTKLGSAALSATPPSEK